jgi:hypothetical protein
MTYQEGDIFEVNTIHNTITYAKIIDSWEDIFFDILECSKDGGNVRLPCRSNMVQNRTISKMIKEGHWRMYKIEKMDSINIKEPEALLSLH